MGYLTLYALIGRVELIVPGVFRRLKIGVLVAHSEILYVGMAMIVAVSSSFRPYNLQMALSSSLSHSAVGWCRT